MLLNHMYSAFKKVFFNEIAFDFHSITINTIKSFLGTNQIVIQLQIQSKPSSRPSL